MIARLAPLLLLAPLAIGCGGSDGTGDPLACDPDAPASRFISCVLSFTPGPGAGHGQSTYPAIIEGPPVGEGTGKGSLDALSLGRGGEIAFGFGGGSIVDGEGPDFVIFENAFLVGGDPHSVFKELGEVSVSDDGVTWVTFPCQKDAYPFTGCAGWNPVLSNPANGLSPFEPEKAGGNPFDLADVGLSSARFIKIRDISNYGSADTAGFDLDAAAVIHPAEP
ncbi:MAG: hypothetical protein QM820_46105 [Minicystis sp.]